MNAFYFSCSTTQLEGLRAAKTLDAQLELLETFSDEVERYDLDELFDGLHYLLTGRTVVEPDESNLLSQAILGDVELSGEDADTLIAYIDQGKLSTVIRALEDVDLFKKLKKVNFATFAKAEVFPVELWDQVEEDELAADLGDALEELTEFYRLSSAGQQHVVVVIG